MHGHSGHCPAAWNQQALPRPQGIPLPAAPSQSRANQPRLGAGHDLHSHAQDALQDAINRYGAPEIVNTDQGSQFTAQGFVDAVHQCGAKLSMDGKGAWRDNVFVERLWRTVKYERVYLKRYESVAQARQDIDQYLAWYNNARPHENLNRQTPNEAFATKLNKLKEAA